jgi:ABC-type transport system involved in multi-copper enzyme maturation permease subunit
MTFLPIVERELRVASRRSGTFWIRAGVALAVIVAAVIVFLLFVNAPQQHFGKSLFRTLTVGALLFCMFQGVRATADCLSEEKREGTLGLLFLTDLKGYDVVLGKLAATSLTAIYSLVAIMPVLGIPLLLGGVAAGEFWRFSLMLVNTLFFSLAAGILVSSLCISARKAMAGTFLFILFFNGALPAFGSLMAARGKLVNLQHYFFMPSAGYTYATAFDMPYRISPHAFWWSLAVIHALGWICLALASYIAPRAWQDRPGGASGLRWRDLWLQWCYGNTHERKRFRERLLGENAFYWLASRTRFKPALVWAMLAAMGLAWAWGAFKLGAEWFNEGIYVATAIILGVLLKGWLASEVVRQLGEERKAGALELLLSTTLSVKEIVRGQLLAMQRLFLGPLLVVLFLLLVFMSRTLTSPDTRSDGGVWAFFWVLYILMLLLDLAALYWLGMWMSLTSRNPNRASSKTVVRILVVPWLAYGLVSLGMSLTQTPDPGPKFFIGLWFGLGLVTDLVYGLWARHGIYTHFRHVAMQRYAPFQPFWQRWFKPARETRGVL